MALMPYEGDMWNALVIHKTALHCILLRLTIAESYRVQ